MGKTVTKIEGFGTRLAIARKRNKMRADFLAQMLHVTRMTIWRWEEGKTEPSFDQLCVLCKILDVSSDWLLGVKGGHK